MSTAKAERHCFATVHRLRRAGYRVRYGTIDLGEKYTTVDVDRTDKPGIIECWELCIRTWSWRAQERALRKAFRRYQKREREQG